MTIEQVDDALVGFDFQPLNQTTPVAIAEAKALQAAGGGSSLGLYRVSMPSVPVGQREAPETNRQKDVWAIVLPDTQVGSISGPLTPNVDIPPGRSTPVMLVDANTGEKLYLAYI